MNKDLVFCCDKCGHHLYLGHDNTFEDIVRKLRKLMKLDCPECGEEPNELWKWVGFGDFDKDYAKV